VIGYWLVAAFEVDDRKAAHRQSHAGAEMKAVVVRPPMTNGLVHPRQQISVNRSAVTANNACYATHVSILGTLNLEIRWSSGGG
jgi:hypothetical protein